MNLNQVFQILKGCGFLVAGAFAFTKDGEHWALSAVAIVALYLLYKLIAPAFYVSAINRANGKDQRDAVVKLFSVANPIQKKKDNTQKAITTKVKSRKARP